MTRRRLWGGVILLASLLTAVGARAGEDELRIAIPAEPETLDTALTTGSYDMEVEANLWEGLTSRDATNHLLPGEAESWEVSPDGLTYTFHLRQGLRYSDGEPIHAADFVYMVRRAADPATGTESSIWMASIVNAPEFMAGKLNDPGLIGISAPDDQTVVVHLKRRSYAFLGFAQEIVPLRQADIAKYGAAWIRPGRMATDGPYLLAEWVPQSHITLTRNPNYWGVASVQIPRITFLFVEDPQTRLKMFRDGDLDIVENAPLREYTSMKAEMPRNLHEEPMVGTYYVSLNLAGPPFKDNLKLRQALALVTDSATVTDKVIKGGQHTAYSYLPPNLPEGYVAQTEFFKSWPPAERLARAKQLYAEAGYGPSNPLKLHLTYVKANDEDHWVAAIAAMWRQALGVEVTTDGIEYRIWLGMLTHHQYAASIDDWESEVRGDADILDDYRSTVNENDVLYADPAFDQALDEADAATTLDEHLRAYEKAERIFIDAQPIIPIFHLVRLKLVSDRVSGWSTNPAGMHRVQFMTLTGR